jgi:DNA (cytosine-5)-methyltransferase 1
VPKEELIFAGCAPCQPFSKQRRQVSRSGSTLLGHFGRLVADFLPGFVVIENVPGIAKVRGNSTYRKFLRTLTSLGYQYQHGCLDAKWFGVPQSRNRWVVIATRFVPPSLPKPTHGPGLLEYRTVRQAIAHFPRLEAGEKSVSVPNHRAAMISPANLKRLRATPRDGGGRLDWPENLVLKCHRGSYRGHSDVYGRMGWDRPAPALTCRCFSISNGRYGHPVQDRAISLREGASLQTFPDDYVFYGVSQAAIGAQIGNAVPVKMGEALGKTILELRRQTLNQARGAHHHEAGMEGQAGELAATHG